MNSVKWGEYRLGDLFEVTSSKKIFHANRISKIYDEQVKGSLPYVSRTTRTNGIRGWVKLDPTLANDSNTLSFAQDTFSVFYQKECYFTGNKIKVLKPKFDKINSKISIFFVNCFNKSIEELTWGVGSTEDSIRDIRISLPQTEKGEIDFAFMEDFVAELEAQRVAELEAYLSATGLNDYTLTDLEQNCLDSFANIKWGEYRVGDLFNISPTKYYKSVSKVNISAVNATPIVSNTTLNNGIIGFSELEPINKGGFITCSDTTLGAETMFYQAKSYIGYQHVQAFMPKGFLLNQKIAHFLISACRKSTCIGYYSYGNKFNRNAMRNTIVSLPQTENGEIDFAFMETFISAIQKLVIRGVVEYKDSLINATKNVIK